MKVKRDISTESNGKIGVTGVLGILFVALKLTEQIDWSWWWVLAPFWMPAAFLGGLLLAMLVTAVIAAVIKK